MPSSSPLSKATLKRLILDLLGQETGGDYSDLERRIQADIHTDCSVDSLSMVNILVDLEERLGIVVEDSEFTPQRLRSLDGFAEFLLEKLSAN